MREREKGWGDCAIIDEFACDHVPSSYSPRRCVALISALHPAWDKALMLRTYNRLFRAITTLVVHSVLYARCAICNDGQPIVRSLATN